MWGWLVILGRIVFAGGQLPVVEDNVDFCCFKPGLLHLESKIDKILQFDGKSLSIPSRL